MKTFEEALSVVADLRSDQNEAYDDSAFLAQCAAVGERYSEITNQVVSSRLVNLMVGAFMQLAASDQVEIHEAMRALFVNGVIVGMEMEKP